MSELRDRLEKLAARGTQRGADAVLDEAKRGVSLHVIAPGADGGDGAVGDDVLPMVTPEPEARRGRFGQLVATVGVAALVGVGALAVSAVLGGGGGAGSPEAAVRQLADAITHKDPLAAVDVLVPSEVRTMRQTVKDATQRAADLKIVDDASQPLTGVDLSVDHLTLTTQTLADGYAKVTITSGEISASTHKAALSKLLQDATRNSSGEAQGTADLAQLASSQNLPTFVIVVRRGGGWYVSPAYTALEYVRESQHDPAADFGSADASKLGADTPESAVSDALHAWQAGNWDRLIALAPPDELPVYDYRAMIDQAATDTHPDFTIDHLTTSATVNGDTAVVRLEASGTSADNGHWQVGGTCPSPWSAVSSSSSSGSSSATATSSPTGAPSGGANQSVTTSSQGTRLCLAGDLAGDIPFGILFLRTGDSTTATGPVSIQVVREDGRWFVSPVSTVLDALDTSIQHVDQRTVYSLLGLAYQLPPDGTITLDQPFSPRGTTNAYFESSVYAFDGTKGEKVVGEVGGAGKDGFGTAEIYTADGDNVGVVEFQPKDASFGTFATALPATGSYRLVLNGVSSGATLTLWDTAHAPKSLLSNDSANFGSQICSQALGGTTCSRSLEAPARTVSPGGRTLTTIAKPDAQTPPSSASNVVGAAPSTTAP